MKDLGETLIRIIDIRGYILKQFLISVVKYQATNRNLKLEKVIKKA